MREVRESKTIAGVRRVHFRMHSDDRGHFVETYRHNWFDGTDPMVQANWSESRAGVLRGLHFHLLQADYWYVSVGQVFVALYDLRRSSPTRGALETFEMGDGSARGVYIPRGVAHGYLTLTEATIHYLVDRYYDDGKDEHAVAWNDPALGIEWPNRSPAVSGRDSGSPLLAAIPEAGLPL